jgi:soluble lytic murein transglycosylase-like protein
MNRVFLTLLALACLGLAAPAAAGSLYRCDGPDGARSYSSTKVSGASCSAMESGTSGGGGASSSAAASGPRKVSGQVYAYVENGVRHYSSVRPRGASSSALRTIRYSYMETCYACAAKPGVDFGRVRLNATAFDSEIASASRQYGVDEAVVRAIIHAESSFNPNARSKAGAQGLMQLMPATASRFGVTDAYDASQNIRGGVKYLAWLLKRFDGNVRLAAAGYNAGEGAVDKYDGVPPYAETRRYVERVGVLADRYRGLLASR